jgi:hypothetical protein
MGAEHSLEPDPLNLVVGAFCLVDVPLCMDTTRSLCAPCLIGIGP